MNQKQRTRLRSLITQHVNAQIELAFKGCGDPEDWPTIEDDAVKARQRLNDFIDDLERSS